jgi:tRNA U34 5-carboxymethylaminomethyl modifying GTPase MnmE/TrmE
MTQPNDPRKVKVIVELIDHTTKIADGNDRGDLVVRLAKAKERITDPQIRVVIAGQLKQGKSQLLNSLLNVPVSRVGDHGGRHDGVLRRSGHGEVDRRGRRR